MNRPALYQPMAGASDDSDPNKVMISTHKKNVGRRPRLKKKAVGIANKRREIPTVRKLAANLNEGDSLPSVSATPIYRMLLKVGFRFKKRYRNSLLIEATHIIQWRRKYLRQIKEVRRQG
ncbi:hypothetical protein HPB51_022729 [Rhipicephalus microplus]|uniref:Uncharacterized protein n=1 Tax=Rhipicephalus microplus TaxID=6941 RepID=A0A9J6EJ36_RHIMP|nr:hypothetical protein HPB51_022729 [Rhipicephalus microplus]